MMKVLLLLALQPLIVVVTVRWMSPSSIGKLVTAVAYPTTSTGSNIPISSSSLSYSSLNRQVAFITKDVTTRRFNRRRIASLYQQIQRPTVLSSSLSYKASSTSTTTTALYYTNQNIDETTTTSTVSSTPSLSSTTVVTTIESISLTGVLVDITFSLHRPLGCIIEESLVTSAGSTTTTSTNNSKNHIVFITSITSNGNAEQAGLLVGDVILGVSTVFTTAAAPTTSLSSINETCDTIPSSSSTSTIMDVTGFGIERVKSLIMCRYDNEPFTLRILRGTTALQDHEVALTELCSNPDTTSTEAEQCMIDYIQGGYATIPDQKSLGTSSKQVNVDGIPDDGECLLEPNKDDDDSECLLNDMHSLWASDLPMSSSQQQQQQQQGSMNSNENSNTNAVPVKPWSSRASPSGTFVRDPITGKMMNLDSTN